METLINNETATAMPGCAPTAGSASSDWQVVSIFSQDFWEEVNCNGGGRRKIRRGVCKCGEVVHVEIDCPRTPRADGKRIFYPEEPNTKWCVFACRGCRDPIGDTCEAAAYGQNDPGLAYAPQDSDA